MATRPSRRRSVSRWAVALGLLGPVVAAVYLALHTLEDDQTGNGQSVGGVDPLVGNTSTAAVKSASQVSITRANLGSGHQEGVKKLDEERSKPYWKSALDRGYALYVSGALSSSDPQLAYNAQKIIKECAGVEQDLSHVQSKLQTLDSRSKLYQAYLQEVQYQQQLQRQCQGISQEMLVARQGLLLRAAKGGVRGAATDYVQAIPPRQLTAEDANWVVPEVIADANAGDVVSIYLLACDWKRDLLLPELRQPYVAALEWAAESSPEKEWAKLWLDRCPKEYLSAGKPADVPEKFRSAIIKHAQARLRGD